MQGEKAPLIRLPGQERAPSGARPLSQGLLDRWFHALYETPLLFTGILDEDGRLLDANQQSIEGCGFVRDEVLGRPFWECGWWSPDPFVSERLHNWCEQALTSGQFFRGTSLYFVADGNARMVDLTLLPVEDDEGQSRYLVATGLDITDALAVSAARERRIAGALSSVQNSEAQAQLRLRRLAEVALELVNAETVDDLTEIIINRGVPVLGASGGAILVPERDGFRLAMSNRFDHEVRITYRHFAPDTGLPLADVWRTGVRRILPNRASGLALWPDMEKVYAATNRLAWVLVPLHYDSQRLGALAVAWVEEREIDDDEVALIEAFAAQCTQALQRIQSVHAQRVAVDRIKLMSETLQRSLLSDPPHVDHLQIAVRYQPAAEEAQVGGDWYDAFVLRDGAVFAVIGDVAGHDQDSAAAMGQVRNLLRGIAYATGAPPAAVLAELDTAMLDLDVDALATATLVRVEPVNPDQPTAAGPLLFSWSAAGHPPPLLVTPDGQARLLRYEPDLLLGIEPSLPRHEQTLRLPPGATVVLYTDGLVERRGASMDDGLDWLAGLAGRLAHLSVEELCDALLAEVDGSPDDDIALLAIRADGSIRGTSAQG